MSQTEKTEKQLNDGLCPDEFEVCVPQSCKLLGYDWEKKTQWEKYVEKLIKDHKLDVEHEADCCWTCNCQPGWKLRGELAIAHACTVHDRIHRQALGFEQVSAIDIGFAMWERQTIFKNYLAIRIHVNRKQPPEQLARAGLGSFNEIHQVLPGRILRGLKEFPPGDFRPFSIPYGSTTEDRDCKCSYSHRWQQILELLKEEFGDRKKLRAVLNRYPISGIRDEDFSIFCPPDIITIESLEDVRLCICGVPIDIINAQYNPSIAHPGGDADSGVFVDPPKGSRRLSNEEHLLIGRGRVNPLVGGISVGSITGQAGTLSTVVWDRTDGTPCVLSNWHVLAGTATAQVGQPTYQPALFDGGTEDDVVARLKRWHLGEHGDAAMAELCGRRQHASGEILGLWHPISGYMKPELNMEVRKWGRTTGFTKGFIDGIHLAINIDYGGGVVRYFRNQFHIAPLKAGRDVSQVGDSGSLVVASFRPLELRNNVAHLCRWLSECCTGHLCAETQKAIGRLQEECKTIECKDICQTINSINVEPYCATNNYEGLCRTLREVRDKLTVACPSICEDMKLFIKLKDKTQVFLEMGAWTSQEVDEFKRECKVITGALSQYEPEANSMIDDIVSTAVPAIIKKRLETLLDFLEEHEKKLNRCTGFCQHSKSTMNFYIEKCEFRDKFRSLLRKIPYSVCKDSTCKDPASLVKCILNELSKLRSPGTTDLLLDSFKAEFKKLGYNPEKKEDWFTQLLNVRIKALSRMVEGYSDDECARETTRAYYAVGMIFAGDTPGSPFGEFAVASDISRLAEELRFSLRPVFEPRSSFRELRVRPGSREEQIRALRSNRSLSPGEQRADPRAEGPQPDIESSQSSGSGG